MIFDLVEKERLERVLEKGGKLMNMTKEHFLMVMEVDFMAAYNAGCYEGVPMKDAAKRYFEEIETELFASGEVLLYSLIMDISL